MTENETWERLHEAAVARNERFYRDPDTGLWVQTALSLGARGHCCGNGCRHCPYPPEEQRKAGRPGA